jgi:predicted AAA+ superfamily ATPase
MTYIPRKAQAQFEKLLASSKVTIILGARQVGKTTLVEHALQGRKALFLNLDLELDQRRLEAAATLAPDDALLSLGAPEVLVIDEAQRLSQTGRIVKGWYDAHLPLKVILLGSSSLDLLDYAAESLTGRNEKLYLPPLLFQEILAAQPWYAPVFSVEQLQEQFAPQLRALLLPALIFGSYPEVVTSADKGEVLANLAADYLFKDVLQLGLVKTPGLIRKLLQLLAYQVGAEVSVSELALTLGIARATVDRYLELMEQTFVIFRLPAFSTNPRKEIAKSHKVFFWDTGIRNALLNEFSLNPLRADIGRLWENWVVAEVAKQNLLSGRRQELYFWRSRAGSEVDLVIKEGEVLRALECKWSERKAASRAFSEHYGVQVEVVTSARPLVTLFLER